MSKVFVQFSSLDGWTNEGENWEEPPVPSVRIAPWTGPRPPYQARENPPLQLHVTRPSQVPKASDSPPSQERANQFVDFVLNSFGSTVVSKKLQPLALLDPPTRRIELTRDMFGFIYTTGATLHNVSISRGLETIARVGNASVKTILEVS